MSLIRDRTITVLGFPARETTEIFRNGRFEVILLKRTFPRGNNSLGLVPPPRWTLEICLRELHNPKSLVISSFLWADQKANPVKELFKMARRELAMKLTVNEEK